MIIETIKAQENGYLVNGSMSVPGNSPGNRHYKMVLEAIDNGVVVEPVDVPDPQLEINAEARAYLASTDWYVIRQQETGEPVPQDILTARVEARARVV